MKVTSILLLLSACASFGQLTVSVTPGYRFNGNENITISKLNQLGSPMVSVAGTVTGSSLAAGGVSAVHISTNTADQLTILGGYDGSSTSNLFVNLDYDTLGIVSHHIGVKTNGVGWAHWRAGQFRIAGFTNNWLDEVPVVTNLPATFNTNGVPYTNSFIAVGLSSNVGTNGNGTNLTFNLISQDNFLRTPGVTNAIFAIASSTASNLLTTTYVATNTNTLSTVQIDFPQTLGAKPTRLRVVLLCLTNDSVWLAGDELAIDGVRRNGSTHPNYSITANATNIAVRAWGSPEVVRGPSDTYALALASWRVKVYAER